MIIATVVFINYLLGVRRFICCYLTFTTPSEVVIATLPWVLTVFQAPCSILYKYISNLTTNLSGSIITLPPCYNYRMQAQSDQVMIKVSGRAVTQPKAV